MAKTDVVGALTHVETCDGTVLDYIIDGQGRRVGKKRNGQLAQGFLYKDQLRIAAELNASNAIVCLFIRDQTHHPRVHAARRNLPAHLRDDLGGLWLVMCECCVRVGHARWPCVAEAIPALRPGSGAPIGTAVPIGAAACARA